MSNPQTWRLEHPRAGQMQNPIVIYHDNCADGFTAAWAVHKAFEGQCELVGGVYQTAPPDVTGRDVVIVDFSYKRSVMEEITKKARYVVWIDHHATAMDDMLGFTAPNFEAFTALHQSGAGLAWRYFFPMEDPPTLLRHVEDRDLWKFAMRNTRQIQASVFAYAYDLKTWDHLMYAADLDDLAKEGEAIERKHFKDIRELIGVTKRMMDIDGHMVPVANLPYTMTSDAGNIMARGNGSDDKPEFPFAACYWDTPKGRVFSLRSTPGGADVSLIAQKFGGGGHKNASGFSTTYPQLQAIEARPEPVVA